MVLPNRADARTELLLPAPSAAYEPLRNGSEPDYARVALQSDRR